MSKQLSNPISTGGGGSHFEACVQASFVTLMLTGGYAPCLPCWPIVEIKLQGKIDGYDTDDLIVFVESNDNKRQKLLGQIKHSIEITKKSPLFSEVIQAAWNDFNNPQIFTKNNDIIALITGPLGKTDKEIIGLTNHARANDSDSFFKNVETAKFSSNTKRKKLEIFRSHLKTANGGIEVQENVLHSFLSHFYCLGYDLGEEEGVVLSLINSHISQFNRQKPRYLWSRILEFTNNRNHHAGVIKRTNIPTDLIDHFKESSIYSFPQFITKPELSNTDWIHHPDATYLALSILIGAWNEKNKNDTEIVCRFFDILYDTWLQKAREIIHIPDNQLSLKNGIWEVKNRVELWNQLSLRILDQNLDIFKSIAVSVLKEPNPAFELPTEDRYAASIYGKVLTYSYALRKGIAEGLAILGNHSNACNLCSLGKAEAVSNKAIHEILYNADWSLWGSLDDLLPILSEAAPDEFLKVVENTLNMKPCPFDELFAQESGGITGRSYLTGLLWALEGLAWDEEYLVRACVALGELANRDPGGKWLNRPANSLVTILLPWLPQTLASIDKRKVVIQTLFKEQADVCWKLIIELLPSQHQASSGSYMPKWRQIIPDDWVKGVTNKEYWEQVSFYAEFAVKAAEHDTARLAELINHFDNLPQPVFDQFVEVLISYPITELSDDHRRLLWDNLTKFTNKHRKFADAEWALPDELVSRIEKISDKFAPNDPLYSYQRLFSDSDFDIYDERGNWEEQHKRLNIRREAAVEVIFKQNGMKGVIAFSETVVSPEQVGTALSALEDKIIEKTLFPSFLNTEDKKHQILINGFIWGRYNIKGWNWCDNLDRTDWNQGQISHFLICLPFIQETWNRVFLWLGEHEDDYWSNVNANYYRDGGNYGIAIGKLIEYGRPYTAINCLGTMLYFEQTVKVEQCIRALLAAINSRESFSSADVNHIRALIRFLQSESSVPEEKLFKIEWAFLPLLNDRSGAIPKLLESKLANDPEFFCEVIQSVYRSKKEKQLTRKSSEEARDIAHNAWLLLREWKMPPGICDNGTFSAEQFRKWFNSVEAICTESGHLEVALIHIGEVLTCVPSDSNGLWIHKAVAAILNGSDAENMRRGFSTRTYNSRGVHGVDPLGTPEKNLAEQFRNKADALENAGFHRFAVTLKDLAKGYEQEAKRIIEYQNESQ